MDTGESRTINDYLGKLLVWNEPYSVDLMEVLTLDSLFTSKNLRYILGF